jgi:NAD(P)H-hydrate epimerase
LGTGTRLPVSGYYSALLEHLQKLEPIVSIDIPSGLDCDSLTFESRPYQAPRAELTVTFTAPKPAHIFSPAAEFSKKWLVLPIGSPPELLEEAGYFLNYFTARDAARVITRFRRSPSSHKGSYGHVLTIGGSLGKTGAASLMASSALLAGAGLVTLATSASCLPIIAGQTLEIMTEALASTDTGAVSHRAFEYGRMEQVLEGKDLLALGPGLGTHQETVQFVHQLLECSKLPAVLDADAINAFAGQSKLLAGGDRTLVLTPHPGELGRLLGISTREALVKRIQLARDVATRQQLHLVVKGDRTLYAAPSGQVYVNSTGNPGMATGGSGDVLTGLLAGLLAQALRQRIPLEEAIPLGIWLHGRAGDLAREVKGELSLIASDLLTHLPAAVCSLQDF